MKTREGKYPWWETEAPAQTDNKIEYKYILKGNNQVIWENGDNRICSGSGDVSIEDAGFNQKGQKINGPASAFS